MNGHADTLTISSVKRVHGRASLILSSGETLTMPRAMLKERPYRSGMPFDRMQFHAFLLERSYPFALDKAVSLLASRARTEQEIVSALRQNAYPEQTIARVMARRFGDQSFKKGENPDALPEELADVLWVLICIANQTGVNLTEALKRSFEKKTRRDANRHLDNEKLRPHGDKPEND